jgi:hypothetical protein
MTLAEIKKIQKLLEQSPENVKKFLNDELLIKQQKQGLIEIQVPEKTGEKGTVKAFPLSKNICVIRHDPNKILSFSTFRNKLTLTHIKSGMRIKTIKIRKADAFRLAEKLERMANLNFLTKEECNEINTIEQIQNIQNTIFEYSV